MVISKFFHNFKNSSENRFSFVMRSGFFFAFFCPFRFFGNRIFCVFVPNFFQCFFAFLSMLFRFSFNAFSLFFQCFFAFLSMLFRFSFNAFSLFFQRFFGFL